MYINMSFRCLWCMQNVKRTFLALWWQCTFHSFIRGNINNDEYIRYRGISCIMRFASSYYSVFVYSIGVHSKWNECIFHILKSDIDLSTIIITISLSLHMKKPELTSHIERTANIKLHIYRKKDRSFCYL